MEAILPFLVSIILGFIPTLFYASIIYFLDRYEKEPLPLLGAVFTWGAVVAAAGAFVINTSMGEGIILVTHSESLANLTTGFMVPQRIRFHSRRDCLCCNNRSRICCD